ncbi:MAG: hypothetical protein ACXVEF_42940 [Polyangiales bacterium]
MRRFAWIGVLVCLGCGGSKKPVVYDASKIPPGTGWQCFSFEQAGPADGRFHVCERTSEGCARMHEYYKDNPTLTACAPIEKAYCYFTHDGGSVPSCVPNMPNCEYTRYAVNQGGKRVSECREQP